jgi:hypothetical protein
MNEQLNKKEEMLSEANTEIEYYKTLYNNKNNMDILNNSKTSNNKKILTKPKYLDKQALQLNSDLIKAKEEGEWEAEKADVLKRELKIITQEKIYLEEKIINIEKIKTDMSSVIEAQESSNKRFESQIKTYSNKVVTLQRKLQQTEKN